MVVVRVERIWGGGIVSLQIKLSKFMASAFETFDELSGRFAGPWFWNQSNKSSATPKKAIRNTINSYLLFFFPQHDAGDAAVLYAYFRFASTQFNAYG